METTKQVMKTKKEMVKEYLQAKGHNSSDKAVESWIRLSNVDIDGAKELMERIGSSPYKTIDTSAKRQYRVETSNGQKKVFEADSPVEALEKMVDYPITTRVVSFHESNAIVTLINGQKKSRNYYWVEKKVENKQEKKEKPEKAIDKDLVLTPDEIKEQKNVIEFYAIVHSHANKGSDYEYYKGKPAYIVPLENGDSYVIEKRSIKTRFCFGYGMYGQSTQEEEDRAYNNFQNATTNAKYFIDENMKIYRDAIAYFSDPTKEFYKYTWLYKTEDEKRFMDILSISKKDNISNYLERERTYKPYMKEICSIQQLSDKEVQSIVRGYKIVAAKMEQRLATYLKKYGLSKLNVWTYLVD